MAKLYDADALKSKELYEQLNFKQKLSHFWTYHKNIFLFALVALIVVGGITCVTILLPKSNANLRIKFINANMPTLNEETNYIISDYETHLGENNSCEMEFSRSTLSEDNDTQAGRDIEGLLMELVACNLELYVFDKFAMDSLCPTGYVVDLNTCLDPTTVESAQDKLVYYDDVDGNRVPMAIDISDTDYVKNAGIESDGVYVGFAANSPNPDIAKEFVTYLLTQE